MDMTDVISVLIMFTLTATVAFFRLPILLWTIVLGVTLLLLSIFGYLSILPLIFLWLCYLSAALIANLHQLRQLYLIQPALNTFKKRMPKISSTERVAIEAGDTWWEKELFCGRPSWRKLFKLPAPSLTAEEQHFLNHQVEKLCSMVSDWQIVFADRDLSFEVWEYLKREKFFGMVIPKQYGGLGFTAVAHSTVITKLATRSISVAVTSMVPNSLGPAELLLRYGTDEQKNYYLPRLASGLDIPCFALTGPEAGSDASSIPDTGIICKDEFDGKETIGIRLTWDKRYITLAPVATVLGLAFHLYDPEKLLGKEDNIGITLCLIPADHPGVEIGNRHYPMYLGFMNGPTRGKDVFIPLDWVVGGKDKLGQGWRMLMECLSIGRSISLPALSTACSKIAYRLTGSYAKIRRQFNTSISNFEGIQEALGYIAGYSYVLEACRMMTAGALDQHINPSIVSAIAKYHMTEMSRKVINHAMDIHAGQMIQAGPRNFLANIYSAVPISITVEGANILTRNLIIFGQGAIRCHPYVLKEIELINSSESNLPELDKIIMKHIGYYISNFFRAFVYGLTGGLFIFTSGNNKHLRRYQRQLTRMSTALALFADTCLITLGGNLKRRERISARLGDILSQLYLASTVIKYFYDHKMPKEDLNNVNWAIKQNLFAIQKSFNQLSRNLSIGFLGKFLYWIIFPFGKAYDGASDKLHEDIIAPMLRQSELRERLTQFCFISKDKDDLSYRLDKALSQIAMIDPILKKLNHAVATGKLSEQHTVTERLNKAEQLGILSIEEKFILQEYELLKNEIIQVNEFSFDLQTVIA